MPHSTEATTKPTTATINTRLRPNLFARNPDGGVMMAAATIYPVAAGVLRRQQREARGGCRTYAVDPPGPSLARIGIDVDRDFLSGPDIGQFGLLRTRLNPDVIGRNDVEC